MIYKAFHLGAKTKAKKDSGGKWMVGGDYSTNNALIMLPCKDNYSGWAWYALKGAILKYQDNATEEEITMTIEEWVEA